MDPRYPEQAVSRVRELMNQLDDIMAEMKNTPVSNRLGELERQGSLVIQEICLVAPRLHEAMMQASRTRRFTLTHQPLIEQPIVPVEYLKEPSQEVVEKYFEDLVEEKPKKEKTSKKKKED